MEVVDARILPAPTIVFNKESQEPKIRPNGGIWSLKNKKLALGSTLSSWSILAFGKETDYPRETINNFLVELVKTLKENGVNVRNPNPPICYGNKNEIEESLYKAYNEACSCDIPIMSEEDEDHLTSISPGINRKLILCILPCRVNNTTPYYAEIKRIADTVIGVVTQCIQGRHITAPIKSYCGNLSLKINVKLGGYNNFILPEQIRFIMEEPTIVFGGNVTNPGPGDRIHPSIVALVGSMDCQCSHYIATTRIQERKKECIIKLSEMIVILFNKFYKINELMPKRILFYRDSISESQYQSVMQYELNEIREACKMIDPNYQPTITYIVVQKRHHARFFPMRKEESDSKGNILAGTVIESLITHPSQFDFYLCSHPGLQGTSRPTHYHVLYDEHNFTADELEELTYHMCFLYSRSTRAVSIVPPAYYAHLAAARVKYHAHEAWNEQEQQQTNYANGNGNAAANGTAQTGNETSPTLASTESLEGSHSGSNSTLASSASSPTLDKSNTSTPGNPTLTSSPSNSSLKTNQPVRRVLYEPVKEELQEIMYFM
jgi:eukaryotic translation initiation factor 2C